MTLAILTGIAWKSFAVLGVAALMARLPGSRSAAARHMVWTAAMATLLLLPLLSVSLPKWDLPGSETLFSMKTAAVGVAERPAQSVSTAPVEERLRATQPNAAMMPRVDWTKWVWVLWAIGTAVLSCRVLLAWMSLRRMRRNAWPVGTLDGVPVLESGDAALPITVGVLRPAIIMPAEAADWSQERRELVLAHELAHVRRGDVPIQGLANIALCLYWWNPLMWRAWRALISERERAADDAVLRAGVNASAYAGHLLEIARAFRNAASPAIAWSAVAMAQPSEMEGRLKSVLDKSICRVTPGKRAIWATVLASAALLAPLASMEVLAQAQAPVDETAAMPADVEATIVAATGQRDYRMLEQIAETASSQGLYEVAQRLLTAGLRVRTEVGGAGGQLYAEGLVKQGDFEKWRSNRQAAEEKYKQALEILPSGRDAARALLALGVFAIGDKELGKATDYFRRAEQAAPEYASRAKLWMAIVRERENKIDEADALYQQARSMVEPDSGDAAVAGLVYSKFLLRQNRKEDATAAAQLAEAARKSYAGRSRSASSTRSDVHRIGGDVRAPKLVKKQEPEYTEEARIAKLDGTAILSVVIETDGRAHDVQVIRPIGMGLENKAVEAVRQWRFSPGTLNGQAVPVMATIEVNFRLL
ncbi:MAG: TonB family protein [Bryobacterales bacterium]|nr:TonB family protein [Bryobacterales bacterium]